MVNTIAGAAVAGALIAAVAVLTWHGSIDGQGALSFFSVIAGGAVVGGVQHVATKTGAKAASRTLSDD